VRKSKGAEAKISYPSSETMSAVILSKGLSTVAKTLRVTCAILKYMEVWKC
jgi:hypothetical protein